MQLELCGVNLSYRREQLEERVCYKWDRLELEGTGRHIRSTKRWAARRVASDWTPSVLDQYCSSALSSQTKRVIHSHGECTHTGSTFTGFEHSDASPASPASPPRSHAPGGAGARRRAYRSTVEIRRHSVLGVGLNCVVHVLDVNYDKNFSCWKVFRRRKAPKVHRGSVCPKRTIPIVSIRILILTNPILILMNFASQVQRLSASSLLNQFSRVLAAFSSCSLSFECSTRVFSANASRTFQLDWVWIDQQTVTTSETASLPAAQVLRVY